MPTLCPQAPDAHDLNLEREPALHSAEGLQLIQSLKDAFKHASQYNREAVSKADYSKRNRIQSIKPRETHRMRATYRFIGPGKVPKFPIEE